MPCNSAKISYPDHTGTGEGHSLAASDQSAILTEAEMQQAVRRNILACLRETGGKVVGPDGAAAVMGVQPTTLYSRLRKFNIAPDEWKTPDATDVFFARPLDLPVTRTPIYASNP